MIKKIVLLLMILMLYTWNVWATNYHIWPGNGSPDDGSTWTKGVNSLTDVDDVAASADTIWVCGGLDVTTEQISLAAGVIIMRALPGDGRHGSTTGWDDSLSYQYHLNSSTALAYLTYFNGENITIDGVIGGDNTTTPDSTNIGFGIKISFTDSTNAHASGISNLIKLTGSNCTISHVDLDQSGMYNWEPVGDGYYNNCKCIEKTGAVEISNIRISYCKIHDCNAAPIQLAAVTNSVIEHCYLKDVAGAPHGNMINLNNCTVAAYDTVRYNLMDNCRASSFVGMQDSDQSHFEIYGNIFIRTGASTFQCTDGVIYTNAGYVADYVNFHHNSMYNLGNGDSPDKGYIGLSSSATHNSAKNNVWYNCLVATHTGVAADSLMNNAYDSAQIANHTGETDEVTLTASPYVSVGTNFHVVTNSEIENQGIALGGIYANDRDGTAYDGTPTLGAYEYTAGGAGGVTNYYVDLDSGDNGNGGTSMVDAFLTLAYADGIADENDVVTVQGDSDGDQFIAGAAGITLTSANGTQAITTGKKTITGFTASGGAGGATSATVTCVDDAYHLAGSYGEEWLSHYMILSSGLITNAVQMRFQLPTDIPASTDSVRLALPDLSYANTTNPYVRISLQDTTSTKDIPDENYFNNALGDSTTALVTLPQYLPSVGDTVMVDVTTLVDERLSDGSSGDDYITVMMQNYDVADDTQYLAWDSAEDTLPAYLVFHYTTGGASADSLYVKALAGEEQSMTKAWYNGTPFTLVALADCDAEGEAHTSVVGDTLYIYGATKSVNSTVQIDGISNAFSDGGYDGFHVERMIAKHYNGQTVLSTGHLMELTNAVIDSCVDGLYSSKKPIVRNTVFINIADTTMSVTHADSIDNDYNWIDAAAELTNVTQGAHSVTTAFTFLNTQSAGADAYSWAKEECLYRAGIDLLGYDDIGAWNYPVIISYGPPWYVDATLGDDSYGGGDENNPLKTLAALRDTLIAQVASGVKDSVYLKAGETWTDSLGVLWSGTADNPDVITRYGVGNDPYIDASGLPYGININGEYIILDNITVRYATASNIRTLDTDYITIQYCTADSAVGATADGIILAGDDYLIDNCTAIGNGDMGIVSAGRRNIISNNIVHDNGDDGIYQSGENNYCIFESNTIYSNGGDGIRLYNNLNNCTIRYNLIYSNTEDGFHSDGNNDDDSLYYNLIYLNGDDNIELGGGDVETSVIVNNFLGNAVGDNFVISRTGIAACKFENNISFSPGGYHITVLTGSYYQGKTNCFWPINTDDFETNSNTFSTLAAWQDSAWAETGSINTYPAFTDTTTNDYTIGITSPCIGIGTIITGLIRDYAGDTVPMPVGQNPDIGAYEEQTILLPEIINRILTNGAPGKLLGAGMIRKILNDGSP